MDGCKNSKYFELWHGEGIGQLDSDVKGKGIFLMCSMEIATIAQTATQDTVLQ
jgi:hypothetical protein